MKLQDILKKKEELKAKEKVEYEEKIKQKKRIANSKRLEAVDDFIKDFKKKSFDPYKDNKEKILEFIAEKSFIDEKDKPPFKIEVSDDYFGYLDHENKWKDLLPKVNDRGWIEYDECIPTHKVVPKKLRDFLSKVEEAIDCDCRWGVAVYSWTTYQLNHRASYHFTMYFTPR
jgi:hypothetical protein